MDVEGKNLKKKIKNKKNINNKDEKKNVSISSTILKFNLKIIMDNILIIFFKNQFSY